ncbi:hypothetical protein ACFQ3N_00975 [Virgibacillus byunsanensis]|uniref:DUF1440 domain-containing protein n=1 Tax=Virgibacillus byunsanensis TaxID=570945 RepID=A0ABW3LJ82_9BACI
MKLQYRLLIVGIVAGLILGGFLKVIERLTGEKVYILLLNVDYIPVLKNWEMQESIEFLLHIVVSSILVFVLYYALDSIKVTHKTSLYIFLNTVIGMALFLPTSLSVKTPSVTDMEAFLYWTSGHVLYGLVVGILITSKNNRGIT